MKKECRFCKYWESGNLADEPCRSCNNDDSKPNFSLDSEVLEGEDILKLSSNFSKRVISVLVTNYILNKLKVSASASIKDLDVTIDNDIVDINMSLNLKIHKQDIAKLLTGGEIDD